MKEKSSTFFLLCGLTAIFICGCSSVEKADVGQSKKAESKKRDYKSDEFRKFVALGESITAGGWSTSPDRCWVSLLGEMINDLQTNKMEVLNYGIGGNVISDVVPVYSKSGKPAANVRLKKHVIDEKPDLLVISYGSNDARGNTPVALFRKELVKIIRRVREDNDPIIVLTGTYYLWRFKKGSAAWAHADLEIFREYNRCIADVAKQEDCFFVDLLNAYKQTKWMVHYDGLHSNDLGHRIVANRIFEVLAQNCSGLAKRTREIEKTSPRWRDESCLKLGFD